MNNALYLLHHRTDEFMNLSFQDFVSSSYQTVSQKAQKPSFENIFTGTSEIKCKKCNSKQISHTQLQTRSADEPMTTFFECKDCNNRWKQ